MGNVHVHTQSYIERRFNRKVVFMLTIMAIVKGGWESNLRVVHRSEI